MTSTEPAWLVELSRQADSELRQLPASSQPYWYRVHRHEPREAVESASKREDEAQQR